ncbi:tape measure protein [Pasteurella multocida]|uniref:tape measure protein n=1 Tax=Pasteurella multocida TaxID=747 RepID=UPI001D114D7E|nr:tape measure protein [Pasteurella multocida]
MNKLSNSVKKVGSGLASLSQKSITWHIALPVLGVGIGAGAGAAAVSKSMIRVAADFEMANIRMKQTFGKRGDEAMAWLKKFATDTQWHSVMCRCFNALMTAGIDPMNGSLQALVDYNAKVGGNADNLNGYISAISKGFIKGKLTMEEVNPLLERNVKVFDILAKQTGGKYTADQMQKCWRKVN